MNNTERRVSLSERADELLWKQKEEAALKSVIVYRDIILKAEEQIRRNRKLISELEEAVNSNNIITLNATLMQNY